MRGAAVVFRDILFLLIGVLILVVVVTIIWMNKTMSERSDVRMYEELIIESRWPDDNPDDIDIWLRVPIGLPIGYSHKNGPICDLLRDDLGNVDDPLHMNFEEIRCRKLVDGEYVLNFHLFSHRSGQPVTLSWAISRKSGKTVSSIGDGTVTLSARGQEVTAVVFVVREGKVVDSFVPEVTVPVRSAK